MQQGSTARPVQTQTQGASESGRDGGPTRQQEGGPTRQREGDSQRRFAGRRWLSEPKAAIWVALAAALLIGGGRKLLLACAPAGRWWRSVTPT